MKKYSILIVLILTLVMADFAFATEEAGVVTSFNGSYRIRGWALNDMDANSDAGDHMNYYDQRFRLKITSAAGEDLKGVVYLEMGDSQWGVEGTGGRLGADEKIVEVKNAYLSYKMDYGKIKAGIMGIRSPKGIIMDDDVAAIVFGTKPTDDLKLVVILFKPYEDTSNMDRDIDVYAVEALYDVTEDIMIGAYVLMVDTNTGLAWAYPSDAGGENSLVCDSARVFFVGLTGEAEMDMISLNADFIMATGTATDVVGTLGQVTAGQSSSPTDVDISGFAADVRGEVNIDAGVGLKIGAMIVYATGDDDMGDDEISSFPTLDPTWMFNNIWSCCKEGGYELHAANGLADPLGFMGLGLYVSASPIDKASVMLRFTNMNYVEDAMDDKTDIGNEIDLNCLYKLNKYLKLYLNLAALMPGDAYPFKASSDDDDPVTEFMWGAQYDF